MHQYFPTLVNEGCPLCTIQRLKPMCSEWVSSFAFNFKLRLCTQASGRLGSNGGSGGSGGGAPAPSKGQSIMRVASGVGQGLTLVQVSAQPDPFLVTVSTHRPIVSQKTCLR